MTRANSELVASAFIAAVLGDSSIVGTTLPRDNTTWSTSGFAQIVVAAGIPEIHVPVRRPVIGVQCWASPSGSSTKPPWGKAATLAELILAGCYASSGATRTLTLPAGFNAVRMFSAWPITEPRRMPSDVSSYARYGFDMRCDWVDLG
jgi:hypothetical protein